MKKIIIFFAIILICVITIGLRFYSYKAEQEVLAAENQEFEQYANKEIYGIDLGSIINKAVDKNTKNNIQKDENNIFIQNGTNSIEIEVAMKETDTTYKTVRMEQIYNKGTELFIQLFIDIKFKCSKVEYHDSTGKIKYMLFEQI